MQTKLRFTKNSGDLCCFRSASDIALVDLLICISQKLYLILWLGGAKLHISDHAFGNSSSLLSRPQTENQAEDAFQD